MSAKLRAIIFSIFILILFIGLSASAQSTAAQASTQAWTKTDILTLILAIAAVVGLLFSGWGLWNSNKAIKISNQSNELNRLALKLTREMFKRQGLFDLHEVWDNIDDIDCNELITPSVIKAVNALSLTASLWNYDIIDKDILFEYFWQDFKNIYEQIKNCNEMVPGKKLKCSSFILSSMEKTYDQMKQKELAQVSQRNL